MDKLFIGVDLSLNSTGICFRYMGICSYMSILNKFLFTSVEDMEHSELLDKNDVLRSVYMIPNVDIHLIDRKPVLKSNSFESNQRIQIANSIMYSELIYDKIREHLKQFKHLSSDNIIISFESISYGSIGDNTIQIAEITSILKAKLIKYILSDNFDNYYSIPGPSIKAYIGHASFDKYKIFRRFVYNEKSDISLLYDEFFLQMCTEPEMYMTGKFVPLPSGKSATIDDIAITADGKGVIKSIDRKTATKNKVKIKTIKYSVLIKNETLKEYNSEDVSIEIPKFKIKSPINDMIDAYFISLYTNKIIFQK